MFDYLVFIGRFQPFHNGHQKIIEFALKNATNVIVLVGSANSPRTIRNPFTFDERVSFIKSAFNRNENARLNILPLNDIVYNDNKWVQQVQNIVANNIAQNCVNPKIGLVGHNKDNSSYYLSLFPNWESVDVNINSHNLSATLIRDKLFNMTVDQYDHIDQVHHIVNHEINRFKQTKHFQELKFEYDHIKLYKQRWSVAPFAPTFITTDAVVIQSGHILLIERKHSPGKGLYALPGGFVNQDEKLKDACIRELREETKLKVPTPVLYGSITKEKTYDDPFRSERGRTITAAFLIELKNDPNGLPKVKGSDDAKDAFWLPLNELSQSNMFEDHYSIIANLLGL